MTAPNPTDAPASVLVARELLRTPMIRSFLRDALNEDADAAPALCQVVLQEDPQLALDLAAAMPDRINAAAEAAAELADTLDRFPTTLTREAAQQWAAALDGEAIDAHLSRLLASVWRHLWQDPESRALLLEALGQAANRRLERLVEAMEQEPGRFTDPPEQLASAMLERLDFGLVRRALAVILEQGQGPLARVIGQAMSRPVVVANLVGAAPPVVNTLLRAGAEAAERLDLPPEVLASALFNLLEQLDLEQVARLVNGAATRVEEAHRGNLILGRHEPAFLPLARRLLEGLVARFDLDALHAAAVALGEDLETALTAWQEVGERRPDLALDRLARLLPALAAPAWPAVRQLLVREAPRRAGPLAGAALQGLVASLERDPALVGRILGQALDTAEPERVGKAVGAALGQVADVFADRPELREAITRPLLEALQRLLRDQLSALGSRLRGGASEAPDPEEKPRRRGAPGRLVGRLMRRGRRRDEP